MLGNYIQYTIKPAVPTKYRWAVQLQLHATPNEGTRAVLDVVAETYDEAVALARDEALGMARMLHDGVASVTREPAEVDTPMTWACGPESMATVDSPTTWLALNEIVTCYSDECLGMASRLENWAAQREGHCLLMTPEGQRPFIDWTAKQLEELASKGRDVLQTAKQLTYFHTFGYTCATP